MIDKNSYPENKKRALVAGCGLSGSVIARELAENGYNVLILERRNHIGGNLYDHTDEYGIRVHDYGPHAFHTKKKDLYDYICKYSEWDEYRLTCGAEMNGICTPTPFNFQTIDDFYSPEEADVLKSEIRREFPGRETVTVVEALECKNPVIKKYAQFLFDNDYRLYTAKQWGISPSEIDPSVLKRVPLRFSYNIGYFDDEYQVMPRRGYTSFIAEMIDHPDINVMLNADALKSLKISDKKMFYCNEEVDYPIIFTGPLDELFECCFGELPYRSLRFEWVHEETESRQSMPIVAYPQEPDFIRIIEYKKLPVQEAEGTTYEVEYSLPYKSGEKNEPYYPLPTQDSQKLYQRYLSLACEIKNLYICGRLGDYKYYNMDQALERALDISHKILEDAG